MIWKKYNNKFVNKKKCEKYIVLIPELFIIIFIYLFLFLIPFYSSVVQF